MLQNIEDLGDGDAEAKEGSTRCNASSYKNTTTKANARKQRQAAAINLLIEWQRIFPKTFARFGASRWPALKTGIAADLAAIMPERDPSEISAALHRYTRALPYLLAHVEGAPRLDLFGQPAGVVTADQAQHAAQLLSASAAATPAKSHLSRPETEIDVVGTP